MRLVLSLLFLTFALSPLSSAQLSFTYDSAVPQEVAEGVQQALEEALVERLSEEGLLNAVLEGNEQGGEYTLSLSYGGERHLSYTLLGGEAESFQKRLATALNYDGLSLFESLPPPGSDLLHWSWIWGGQG